MLPTPSSDSTPISSAHHVDHPLGDREAEAESLLLERARAAVEALEDALHLFWGDSVACVADLDQDLVCPCRRARSVTTPGASVFLNAFVSSPISTWRRRTASASAAKLGLDLDLDLEPVGRRDRLGGLLDHESAPRSPRSCPRRPPRSAPATSSESVRRLTRSASSESRAEEVLAGLGVVLRAGAQHLDRARDAGDRVAQLVGGVGDELALGELAPKRRRAIADDGEHRVLGRQLARADRVDAVADLQAVVLRRPSRRPPAEARARSRRSTLPSGPISGSAAGFENRTSPSGADDHHGLVERVEDRRQPVPLRRERAERLPQRDPHRLQRRPELGDLVAAAGPLAAARRAVPRVIRAALSARRLTREVIAVAIRNPITIATAIATAGAREAIAAQRLDRLGDLLRSLGAARAGRRTSRPFRNTGARRQRTESGSESTAREPRRATATAMAALREPLPRVHPPRDASAVKRRPRSSNTQAE